MERDWARLERRALVGYDKRLALDVRGLPVIAYMASGSRVLQATVGAGELAFCGARAHFGATARGIVQIIELVDYRTSYCHLVLDSRLQPTADVYAHTSAFEKLLLTGFSSLNSLQHTYQPLPYDSFLCCCFSLQIGDKELVYGGFDPSMEYFQAIIDCAAAYDMFHRKQPSEQPVECQ